MLWRFKEIYCGKGLQISSSRPQVCWYMLKEFQGTEHDSVWILPEE
jgi:hypothetical protein